MRTANEKQSDELLNEIQAAQVYLATVADEGERRRIQADIDHAQTMRHEHQRNETRALTPDAYTKRRWTAGRVKAVVEQGKHKPKSTNAQGQTVDVCREDYIRQRQAKNRNTHNAAAGVVAGKYGFTTPQVKRAAERGKWFDG